MRPHDSLAHPLGQTNPPGYNRPVMAIEVRPAREEELERVHFLVAYSFAGDRSPEGRERMRHVEEMSLPLALFEDGEMVACLRLLPLAMLINGASIPLGGVSAVSSLPEHRRRGHVGQLLRHSLAVMREQGQPLSALYTPHPSLYRRYGWMIASSLLRYAFNPKDVAPVAPGRPAGRAYRLAQEEEWPTIAQVYRQFTAGRNGYLDRSQRWWREARLRRLYDEKRRLNDIAVWADEGGQPRGYLIYYNRRDRRPGAPHEDRLMVEEFIALDAEAYLGLLRYLLSHDLAEEITWQGPVDEPLLLALDEPGRLRREHHYGFMLRVVDVEKAIAARPAAAQAPEGAFTLQLADASAPWNQGTWRIECSGGRLQTSRVDGPADLSMGADVFAALYNGFLRPSEAVRSGLARCAGEGALPLADAILAADHPPFPSDFF